MAQDFMIWEEKKVKWIVKKIRRWWIFGILCLRSSVFILIWCLNSYLILKTIINEDNQAMPE